MTNKLFIISALILFLFGCSQPAKEMPLKIAISPWPGYSYAMLAKELGYLDSGQKKLVDLVEYSSLNQSRQAFENGNVDGMFSTIFEVIQSATYSGRLPNIVMITDFSNGLDKILGLPEITSVSSLKGKRVGVENASVGIYVLTRALQKHNISLDEVTMVIMEQEEMLNNLKNKQVDAVVSYPPYADEINHLAPNTIFHSGQIENEIIDVLSIDSEKLRHHKSKVSHLVDSWEKAMQYSVDHPEKSASLMKKLQGYDSKELAENEKNLYIPGVSEQKKYFQKKGELDRVITHITNHFFDKRTSKGNITSSGIINSDYL